MVSEQVESRLNWLCDFHLELQNPAYAIPNYDRSIHSLLDATRRILANQDLETIVQDSYGIDPKVLQQVLGKLRSANAKGHEGK